MSGVVLNGMHELCLGYNLLKHDTHVTAINSSSISFLRLDVLSVSQTGPGLLSSTSLYSSH